MDSREIQGQHKHARYCMVISNVFLPCCSPSGWGSRTYESWIQHHLDPFGGSSYWNNQRILQSHHFRKYQPFSKNQPQEFEYHGFGQASYNEIGLRKSRRPTNIKARAVCATSPQGDHLGCWCMKCKWQRGTRNPKNFGSGCSKVPTTSHHLVPSSSFDKG